MTTAEALHAAAKRLIGTTDSPRLDAEVLMAFVIRSTRLDLLAHPERHLSESRWRSFQALVERRRRGLPIPYLTGHQEFFGLDFRITQAVLVPRPFTESLAAAVVDVLPLSYHGTIIDIGTGSGVIAVTIATALPKARVGASDVSPAALRIARANAKRHRVRIRFRLGSLLTPWRRTTVEVVIANLPYLTSKQAKQPSLRYEPRLALDGGPNGMTHIRRLLRQLDIMPSVNTVALEIDPTQIAVCARLLAAWSPRCRMIRVSDGRRTRGLIAIRTK